jgi:hypothetical protein
MKKILIRVCAFLVIFMIPCNKGISQVKSDANKIRIYSFPVDPRQHPDYSRHFVKTPDAGTFGNQIQFMALRSLDDDYIKLLDEYTVKYSLGNIIWASYPLIYRKDLPDVVSELKRRGLYLFDLWGYVPGSGPGGYSQQFVVPENTLNLFQKELGDHWLGMDNGEQDGRYIGGFAQQLVPVGSGREQQYLNFQNHFQGLADRLGNKLATLVSLNFGHYFLKEGVYTLIGAETAQGLPNAQVYYSFIRGAGKQYGVPWFGNASVWNRWGWKNYSGITSDNGGETKGTSLSLLKRLIYSHIIYNCVAVGFEASFLNKNDELSPIGKIQQSASQWVKKYGNPGIMYTPVAVMVDFFSGWSFPRHLYSGYIYRVWGNLPYEEGDYLTDGILNMFYPGYQNASYFHDETGFITPTPYGDEADCILTDSPLWLLKQYPVLVIGGKIKGGNELKDKLESYMESGGHLIITSGSLQNIPEGLSGISVGQNEISFDANSSVSYNNTRLTEPNSFKIKELVFPAGTRIIASSSQKPLVIEYSSGSGKITVIASPFGISSNPLSLPKSKIDSALNTPFPLLHHVVSILDDVFTSTRIFDVGESLSLITCHKFNGEYTLVVCNNTWLEKPLKISSVNGRILKLNELSLDCSEQKAVGFLPENVVNKIGRNTSRTIAGGDIRIFRVMIEDKNIEEISFIKPVPNPVNRGLTLRNISSIKEEILLRPTFFQHLDRVIIDWKYLLDRERSVLEKESGWITRQGLKLIVDFSSGINLFPDLRLVNNDSIEYYRSLKAIESVIEKMAVLGASDLILSAHRTIENNFSRDKFNESLQNTIREICRYSAKYKINVNMRMASGRSPVNLQQAIEFVKSVNEPNFYISPASALLMDNRDDFNKNIELLKGLKFRIFLVAAPERDIYGTLWNINLPINKYNDIGKLIQLISSNTECSLVLDGIYSGQDEEYLDIKAIEGMN